jgi:hypothetical protein
VAIGTKIIWALMPLSRGQFPSVVCYILEESTDSIEIFNYSISDLDPLKHSASLWCGTWRLTRPRWWMVDAGCRAKYSVRQQASPSGQLTRPGAAGDESIRFRVQTWRVRRDQPLARQWSTWTAGGEIVGNNSCVSYLPWIVLCTSQSRQRWSASFLDPHGIETSLIRACSSMRTYPAFQIERCLQRLGASVMLRRSCETRSP